MLFYDAAPGCIIQLYMRCEAAHIVTQIYIKGASLLGLRPNRKAYNKGQGPLLFGCIRIEKGSWSALFSGKYQ